MARRHVPHRDTNADDEVLDEERHSLRRNRGHEPGCSNAKRGSKGLCKPSCPAHRDYEAHQDRAFHVRKLAKRVKRIRKAGLSVAELLCSVMADDLKLAPEMKRALKLYKDI